MHVLHEASVLQASFVLKFLLTNPRLSVLQTHGVMSICPHASHLDGYAISARGMLAARQLILKIASARPVIAVEKEEPELFTLKQATSRHMLDEVVRASKNYLDTRMKLVHSLRARTLRRSCMASVNSYL
eukprot:4317291-Amphidinium_carterae.3